MARATPTTNPPRSTMIDPNLLQKERQDEARRQQQADERVHDLEQENERLRTALQMTQKHLYGSRSAYDSEPAKRRCGHFGAPQSVKITKRGKRRPSVLNYRVEVIEAVAEEIKSALDGGGDAE